MPKDSQPDPKRVRKEKAQWTDAYNSGKPESEQKRKEEIYPA